MMSMGVEKCNTKSVVYFNSHSQMKIILALIILFSTAQAAFSNELSSEEKEIIYIEKRLDPSTAVAFNLIPFGVGSFMQGDYVSGTVISIIDLSGLYVSLSFASLSFASLALQAPCESCPSAPPTWLVGTGFAVVSFGIMYLIGRALGIVAPYIYDSQFDEKLRKDLKTRQQPQLLSFSFAF